MADQRWQYKVINLYLPGPPDGVNMDGEEELLNAAGADRWELTSVIVNVAGHRQAYLKRLRTY